MVHYAHVEMDTVDKEQIGLTSKAFNLTNISHCAKFVANSTDTMLSDVTSLSPLKMVGEACSLTD